MLRTRLSSSSWWTSRKNKTNITELEKNRVSATKWGQEELCLHLLRYFLVLLQKMINCSIHGLIRVGQSRSGIYQMGGLSHPSGNQLDQMKHWLEERGDLEWDGKERREVWKTKHGLGPAVGSIVALPDNDLIILELVPTTLSHHFKSG